MLTLWHSVLAVAVQAPSPHNVQPWRIRLHDERRATLFLDRAAQLPYTDHTGSFMILALGTLVEAIRIVASNRGFMLRVTPLDDTGETGLMPYADLALEVAPFSTVEYPDELFLKRRTSRVPLLPDVPACESIRTIKALAEAHGQHYTQEIDPRRIRRVLHRNIAALIQDMNDTAYRGELSPWLRYSERHSTRVRDGLDARCMAMHPAEYWGATHFPKLLTTPVLGDLMRQRYRHVLGDAPAIGMISGPFWDRAAAGAAGSFLMRFWLELTRHDLYIHPLGNLVTNRSAAGWLRCETGCDGIWLAFKIGYSPEPPKSRRKSLGEVLLASQ